MFKKKYKNINKKYPNILEIYLMKYIKKLLYSFLENHLKIISKY